MNWYLKVLKQYADFKGRASRTEYWMFILFNLIFATVALILDNVLGLAFGKSGIGILYSIFVLALLVPSVALSVRRMHDINKTGLMVLVGLIPVVGTLYLIYLLAKSSFPGENKYGENPTISYNYDEETDSMQTVELSSDDSSIEDSVILIIVIWMAFSRLFWALVPIFTENHYSPVWYELVNMLMGIVWAFVPFGLAFAVKNRVKQTTLFVIGGLYLMYSLIEVLQSFAASGQSGMM
ncbi:DUF805 domain-containing protein [Sunxiuqinia indica]|uniref:DUF805 domain-containing protein n=1 Tax=Sunxiuqinia indica TaxID=2692584 RepID=UPI001357BC7B|nr:DUF805 domain-containing protein [Sunxiuqinia indica]